MPSGGVIDAFPPLWISTAGITGLPTIGMVATLAAFRATPESRTEPWLLSTLWMFGVVSVGLNPFISFATGLPLSFSYLLAWLLPGMLLHIGGLLRRGPRRAYLLASGPFGLLLMCSFLLTLVLTPAA